MDRLGEPLGFGEIRFCGLEPQHVGVLRVRASARDRRFDAVFDHEEAFRRPLTGTPAAVVFVDVAREQAGAVGIGPRDQQRVHPADIGREPRRDELGDELACGYEDLAAQMAALFDGRKLIFEVHAGGARRDHQLHELVGIEHAAESRLCVRDQRYIPIDRMVAVHVVDLIGAPQRVLNAHQQIRHAVGWIETLVGIHGQRTIRVRRDLPAADVDRLETGPHLLDRLIARDGGQHRDVGLFAHELPEAGRAVGRERVLNRQRAAQAVDIFGRVAARDPLPAPIAPPAHIELRDELALTHTALALTVSRDVHRPPR